MNEAAVDYLQQAITLMQAEKYEDAAKYADKALVIEPRYKEAYTVKADAFANMENFQEALDIYNKVLLIDPKDGEIYFNIGNLYVILDDLVKCIKNYNKADQLGFHYFGMYKNLADIYRQLEKEDLAMVNYNKAIRCEPLRADIRLEKAGYQILRGKFQEALETIEELQSLEPDLYDAIAMRAEIYSGLKKYEDALKVVNDGISNFPDDVALRVEKARILTNSGNIDEASGVLSDIKKMDFYENVFRSTLLLEAQIASMKNDLDTAGKALEEILAKEDEFDEEVNYLALNIYFAKDKLEKAYETAKLLSARENENLYTMSGKMYVPQILQRIGKNEEALAEYRRLASYFRTVTVRDPHFYEVYLYRLLCHKEIGEYDKALELADYIETLNPSSSDAYAMRYTIYKAMGQTDKMEEMKKIVAKINPELKL